MLEAIVQGLIQGLTEFLPVSSSGHLVLAQHLFGFHDLDPDFNVFVQGGTVISLLLYYFPKLKTLKLTPSYLGLLALASLPAVVAGLFLERYLEPMFSSLDGLAFGFLLTTIFIWSSKFVKPKGVRLNRSHAATIGLAQAAAILPSLSRSGATIGTALALGISAETAFDFSFLMSIPVLTGSTILSARHIAWDSSLAGSYFAGFFVASIVGYLTLALLARILKRGQFYLFAPYTLGLALLSFYLA